MKNRRFTRTLAVALSAAVCVTAAMPAVPVQAQKKAKTVTLVYSVCDAEKWVIEPTAFTVSADLDKQYADLTGYTDTSKVPTMLDATIAANAAVAGTDDFGFKAGDGYITAAFGKETGSVGYYINDAQDDGQGNYYGLTTELKDGDEIRFFFYQDTESWSDKYVFFDKTSVNAKAGTEETLTASYFGFDENWLPVKSPAAGLDVTFDGEKIGTTDENGNVTFTVEDKGLVSAKGTVSGSSIAMPYCVVNTGKIKWTVSADVTDFEADSAELALMDQNFDPGIKTDAKIKVKKISGDKCISVSKDGKIVVKKGTAAGKYSAKVKVTAKGDASHAKAVKKIKITVVVK